MEILLTIITLLLAVVGYFLRQIHTDFKAFKNVIIDFNTRLAVRDEREKNYNEKLANHEMRINDLEKKS